MGRAPCCEKVGLKKGRWTNEEDEALTKYIQTHGEGSWRSLPKNAGLLRCGKSCRLRWINYLRDDLKRGNISSQEEDMIIKLHASLGNRWSLIASQLPGRTDNEIKNYWNSHLCRKIDTFRRPNGEALPILLNLSTTNKGPSKKICGRTSRATMKKNKNTKESSGNIVNTEQENQEVLVPGVEGTLGYSNNEDSDINNVGSFEMGDLMLYGPADENQYHQESCNSTNSNSNNTSDLSGLIVPDDGLGLESGLMSFLDINYEGTNNSNASMIIGVDDHWDWQGFIHENLWSTFEQDDQVVLDTQKLEEEKMLSCFWENSDGQESSQKQDALMNWLLS